PLRDELCQHRVQPNSGKKHGKQGKCRQNDGPKFRVGKRSGESLFQRFESTDDHVVFACPNLSLYGCCEGSAAAIRVNNHEGTRRRFLKHWTEDHGWLLPTHRAKEILTLFITCDAYDREPGRIGVTASRDFDSLADRIFMRKIFAAECIVD